MRFVKKAIMGFICKFVSASFRNIWNLTLTAFEKVHISLFVILYYLFILLN